MSSMQGIDMDLATARDHLPGWIHPTQGSMCIFTLRVTKYQIYRYE
jgi:hypothetical protein